MNTTNNGGPAFPAGSILKSRSASDPGADFVVTDVVEPKQAGMTLRDYFAAKAITGCLPGPKADADERARWAYRMADAMLAARNSESEGCEA
jgi:hypothetical protein